MDGNVASATLGMDYADHRMLAGVAFSHSRGDGSFFDDRLDGEAVSSLAGLYPYVYVGVNERVSVWGAGGIGSGTLKLRLVDMEANTETKSAAVAALQAGLAEGVTRTPAPDGCRPRATRRIPRLLLQRDSVPPHARRPRR